MENNPSLYIDDLIKIVTDAGEEILKVYQKSKIEVEIKQDNSPVTEADKKANDIIVAGLKALTPEIPVVSEESKSVPYELRSAWNRYWLVDPLDGTKEFINRTNEFTVNIAYIDNHRTILGMVYDPVRGDLYYGVENEGAFLINNGEKRKLNVRPYKHEELAITVSRSRTVQLSENWPLKEEPKVILMGSSLKFCQVARGSVDFYPQYGKTSEWDTAAAQCVLEQAGGQVIDFNGDALLYNTKDSLLNPPFLAIGDHKIFESISLEQLKEGAST